MSEPEKSPPSVYDRFPVGSHVQLRSGGPKLTVLRLGPNRGVASAWCSWTLNDGTPQKDWFQIVTLDPWPATEP